MGSTRSAYAYGYDCNSSNVRRGQHLVTNLCEQDCQEHLQFFQGLHRICNLAFVLRVLVKDGLVLNFSIYVMRLFGSGRVLSNGDEDIRNGNGFRETTDFFYFGFYLDNG